jgi:hypothetical protein
VSAAGEDTVNLENAQLTDAFQAAAKFREFDAYARTYAGHCSMETNGRTVRLVPLRAGTTPIGLLAA